ncbi:MAG: hypothetical protein GY816_05925 [Cytophagales bacterium]|nr:hypothetical protein [Cytophagales bacterium]
MILNWTAKIMDLDENLAQVVIDGLLRLQLVGWLLKHFSRSLLAYGSITPTIASLQTEQKSQSKTQNNGWATCLRTGTKNAPVTMTQTNLNLSLFKQVLAQKKSTTKKIYSMHEAHVMCIS